ncbi:MAG TPA: hypothetical protein VF211_06535 [Burkholderiales bacterium]
MKLIASAAAAALLAVATASFGQSGTSMRPEGSSGSNTGGVSPRMSGGDTSSSYGTTGSATSGATSASSRCAALTGAERDRCLKEAATAAGGSDNPTKMRPEGSSGSNIGGVSPRMGGSSSDATTR